MQQEIDPQIKQAERVRENGKTQQALKMLGVLAEEFANSESWPQHLRNPKQRTVSERQLV
jgi:hypothetical protein